MWKEAIVTKFEALSTNLPDVGETTNNPSQDMGPPGRAICILASYLLKNSNMVMVQNTIFTIFNKIEIMEPLRPSGYRYTCV
jgi:hypothetical protein